MRLFCLFVGLVSFIPFAFSQTASHHVPDTTRILKVIQTATEHYQKTIGAQSHLYNGWEYVEYDNHINGHQFFISDYMEEGTVVYDGVSYFEVPMLFDIVKDQLVVENMNATEWVILISEKVKKFSYLNHTFVRLTADTSKSSPIQSGFYDQLYNGQVKVYAKRAKIIEEEIVHTSIKRSFTEKNNYFIWKEGRYYPVKSKSSVMHLFTDRKKVLGKYLREQKIKFKQQREEAIVKLAIYYDELGK